MVRWVKVAESENEVDFNGNNLAEIVAEGKRMCLARFGQQMFAFAARCPHASGYLVNGYIDVRGNVVCPLHRYRFCLKNGRNVSGEGYYLKHWPVENRADGIFVGLESNKFLGLF